jgi:signal peptidase I
LKRQELPPGHYSAPDTILSLDNEECMIAQAPLMGLIQEVLGRGSCMKLQAKGYSMNPFIKEGDVLTLSPMIDGAPKVGDVVAFKLPEDGKLAIHRVIKSSADLYLIKGDCCSEPDGYIFEKDILGLVSGIERDGNTTRLGLGPEKILISFLSGKNMLWLLGKAFPKRIFR